MEQVKEFRGNHSGEKIRLVGSQQSIARTHACKGSQRSYRHARDLLKRAERDLAETAAFIAGSLTTVTAVQAVITLARKELELPMELLQWAFQGYVVVILLIFFLGAVRVRSAIRRRAQAEKELDQAKKGIIEFCGTDQWPKLEG